MYASAIDFHTGLIVTVKNGAYQSGAPYATPLLAHKYYTWEEVNVIGKHSSLLRRGKMFLKYRPLQKKKLLQP